MITVEHYLVLAALLFCVGLYGVLSKRNLIAMLLGLELMLNSVNINLIAINKYLAPAEPMGHIFVLFVILVAAAEIAVGLALALAIYRERKSSDADQLTLMRW